MAFFVLLVIFGSLTSMVLGVRYMKHRERLTELEVRRLEAIAKVEHKALPGQREKLAAELLAAYDEANHGLSPDP
jgi:hypothetical protein